MRGYSVTMAKVSSNVAAIVEKVTKSPAGKVKVAITDIDGVLRGKYIHKDKFLSALEGGFGFCNVVFGWDAADVCYDRCDYTGWHTGYPDAHARLDFGTYRAETHVRFSYPKPIPVLAEGLARLERYLA